MQSVAHRSSGKGEKARLRAERVAGAGGGAHQEGWVGLGEEN